MQFMSEFLLLALVHFLAVVLPGPDFIITVRNSIRYGYFKGTLTALGIGAGISIHVIYTLIGVSIIIKHSIWLMSILKVLSAMYLFFLGYKILINNEKININFEIKEQGLSNYHAFTMGFMTNALNPKATIFFLSIFTTLVSVTTPLKIQAVYGIWMCMVNALWFIFVAKFFSYSSIREQFLKNINLFEKGMGAGLILLAIILLLN